VKPRSDSSERGFTVFRAARPSPTYRQSGADGRVEALIALAVPLGPGEHRGGDTEP